MPSSKLRYINAVVAPAIILIDMWHFIGSFDAVPNDCDLVVAVLDKDGLHALEFRCRHKEGCWINAKTGDLIEVHPTHWRHWET